MDTAAQWPQQDMVLHPSSSILSSVERNNNNNKVVTKAAHKERGGSSFSCPRCNSNNTKFCYYNNYSLSQPRFFCKTCRRYWTQGGSLRNIPVGGASRKKNNNNKIRVPSPTPSSKKQQQNPSTSSSRDQDLNLGFNKSFADMIQLPTFQTTNSLTSSSSSRVLYNYNYALMPLVHSSSLPAELNNSNSSSLNFSLDGANYEDFLGAQQNHNDNNKILFPFEGAGYR